MNFIEELKWRGMIHDIMPGTEEQFEKEMTSAYIGFDPTSKSLHIGSLVPVMILVHLQRAGKTSISLCVKIPQLTSVPSINSSISTLLSCCNAN